ncbi:sulfotransferase-like domain-containing protein [Neolewinella agarilytica]|nr:hypothetical protein [Neolewinella agarilytica]
MATTQRINLWSSPRNISTALMYSLANHPDIRVVDEPLYAHYLIHQRTEAKHPGKEEILASQPNDGTEVVRSMLTADFEKPIVIFKQMTHHLIELDRAFIGEMHNVLLIRNPRAILASFSKVVDEVTAEDIGLPQQYELFQSLRASGRGVAVLDARKLLEDPRGVLSRLCANLGIQFNESMLSWPAGARVEDGVWAKYWYANVHKSTGFQPFVPKEYSLTPALETIARSCEPLYQEMLAQAF